MPLACLLVLPYGALAACQARAEARENASIERRWGHEGQLHADRLGVEWPGVTK